jgi:arylsulfatase A-like enzyme
MTTRRGFLASSLASPLLQAAQLPDRQPKTNVLLILADDLGFECLSCYGSTSYRTPNLDRIAAEGVRFTHAYAQPLCTPTRVQLMTGLYNHRNWEGFGIMNPKEVTFGHRMRQAGYRTAMAGKWQFYSYNPPDFEPEWRSRGMLAKDAGFEEYSTWHSLHTEDKGSRYGDPTYVSDGRLFKDMKDQYGDDVWSGFLLNFLARHKSEPNFLYYPMALTHGPFNPTPKSADWNTAKRLKNDRAYFKDMVEYMDEVVGRMRSRLESQGLASRTLVLFFADNGTDRSITSMLNGKPYRGGKGNTTDAGTRVPMIAWGAGVKGGRVVDDLVDSTDFLPTLYDVSGAPVPPGLKLDGRSFAPQLRGERGNPREWTFCWHDPRPGHGKMDYSLQIYARDKRWKLYKDGRLFDVPADPGEVSPIAPGAGGSDAASARERLQSVFRQLKVH